MGYRYELIKNCVYCKETNDDIYYAPTCGFLTFKCKKCEKENFITSIFTIKKIEDITYDDIYDSVSMASNIMNEEQIESYAEEIYENIKKGKLESEDSL